MKKPNTDAVGSISTLEIAARAMFLLQDDYDVDGKTQNELTQDVLNAQFATDNLLAIQAQAMAHIEILEQASD